ncbi:MAG: 3-deoxy-8-phosphooctulonate synthase [Planctomycetaceae bacterium]|nr:3-deoxy-8-phosphooctulonate synthase [Planctomycetaceae bacterium]
MTQTRRIRLGAVEIGGGGPLVLIGGPCVIESEKHARSMAEQLARIASDAGVPYVFKASYDKANRSSVGNFRGPGLREGLRILRDIKRNLGVPVLSDVHKEEEIPAAAEVLDVLQIPAFLCRQTDFLVAAGKTGKPVNIKKGQFMAPWDMANAVGKVASTGNEDVVLTERGASFGYNNLVSDMRALPIMRATGKPVVFDATHSVQLPGGQGTSSGGDRSMARVLARAAVAAGVDGVFMEIHDNPDAAKCDGPNMIALRDIPALLQTLVALDRVAKSDIGSGEKQA